MTSSNPTQGYETGIFQQLVKNSEATAVIQYKLELVEKQVNKIPSIETRLDNIETRLDNIETRLDNVETRLGNIEEQVAKIPTIETELKNLDSRLQNLEKIPETIKNGIRWIIVTIIFGIAINIFSAPIVANLFS